MKIKVHLPLGLTTIRLLLGPVALVCACSRQQRYWFLPIMITGLLTDIYDGVLARRWKVSTAVLRRYDSLTDILFYSCIIASLAILSPALVMRNLSWLVVALAAEVACLGFALIRFGKIASAHSYLAKFFGLMLFAGLTTLLCNGGPVWILPMLSILCVATNAEIILMMLVLGQPPVDVLSVFHLLRKKSPKTLSSKTIQAI